MTYSTCWLSTSSNIVDKDGWVTSAWRSHHLEWILHAFMMATEERSPMSVYNYILTHLGPLFAEFWGQTFVEGICYLCQLRIFEVGRAVGCSGFNRHKLEEVIKCTRLHEELIQLHN